MTEAMDRAGLEHEFVAYPWTRLIEKMETGEINILIDVVKNDERLEFMYYSDLPFKVGQRVLYSNIDNVIEFDGNFDSISNYKIGAVNNYSYGSKFDEAVANGIISLEVTESDEQNFTKLINNRLDLLIVNKIRVSTILDDVEGENKVVEISPPVDSVFTYVTFSKKSTDEELVSMFNSAL